MRALKIVRANAAAYVVLVCMFCFVAAYQVRISLDTVHVEQQLDFYVPFLVDPFTDRISAGNSFQNWEPGNRPNADRHFVVRARDELISVNGRTFRGMSLYLRELYKTQHRPWFERNPFAITVRSRDARIHHVEFGLPHCTCGVPTVLEAAALWIAPPMFCILLGFVTVSFRPRAMLAWAFLGVTLSLSQFQYYPDFYTGFQQTVNAMTWMDWFRVPAVGYRSFFQHAWPAAFVAASAYFYQSRRGVYRLAMGVAASFLIFATLEAMLQVAWSEDFRKLVSLYGFLEEYRTVFTTTSLAGVAAVAWFLNRRLGVAIVAIGLLATVAPYWRSTANPEGHWQTYYDSTTRFVATVPVIHNTRGFIVLLYVTGCVLAGLIVVRRKITRLETASLILCLPPVVDQAGTLGGYWYLLDDRMFEYFPWCILASAGLGLAGIAWSVVRRTKPAS